MGQPLPPEIILPGGQRAYLNPYKGTYTKSRSYALRMQRGYSRGLPQYEARGKPAAEYSLRSQQAARTGQPSPYQQFTFGFRQRYGFSYRYWRYLKRNWVDEINRRSSPEAQITPSTIAQVAGNWQYMRNRYPGYESWEPFIEDTLDQRLEAQIEYQDNDNKELGARRFGARDGLAPIELYWYH